MTGHPVDHEETLLQTPLHANHVASGGRLVPFAGYEMPVQYADGIMAEHNQAREQAALFDVSHMGQVLLIGDGAGAALERLVPGDVLSLASGAMRYTQLTSAAGGIIDDLMVTRVDGGYAVVVNAARKDVDIPHLREHLGTGVSLEVQEDKALIALQGPRAVTALARHCAAASSLGFMTAGAMTIDGRAAFISRSGYTGEDGFEISVNAGDAPAIWDLLMNEPEVAVAGLGARDSLRLEAGLCLYGHDIDETTSPIEAALTWSVGKRRRAEGGFLGEQRILAEIANGPSRRRVGILPSGRAPVREGAVVHDAAGAPIGAITSGGFGPTATRPVAMGYVDIAHAKAGTPLFVAVRGKMLPATVEKLPFVSHNYFKS
ncbi:MAG: glycine cleavage system aminomethyltransferase GcvT [Alphaproteobacteria bacterium]|jgi:aminomethyltransferase|nr:glycine cleavage system aminomethyltransferase GcvT [Alphaproteobacteria bacterium]